MQYKNIRGKKKKFRVIVRQWTPRKTPFAIPKKVLQHIFSENREKLKEVVYVGWKRRVVEGKRILQFVVSTGNTSSEARRAFKKNEKVGDEVWIVSN